jgi:hypothetical protein
MSNAGPGLSPNKQSQSGKVAPHGAKKIFSAGGVKGSQPKAPQLQPGQSSKHTGK